jgi:hypothetical protein
MIARNFQWKYDPERFSRVMLRFTATPSKRSSSPWSYYRKNYSRSMEKARLNGIGDIQVNHNALL